MEDNKDLNICRACLGCFPNIECFSLFRLHNGRPISELIISIAKVEIGKGDGLPEHICNECFNDLEKAWTFKQKCEYSYLTLTDATLKSVFVNPPIVQIKEELPIEHNFDHDTFDSDSDSKEFHESITKELDTLKNNNNSRNKASIDTEPLKKNNLINLNLQCDDCKEFFRTKCKMRVHWKNVHERSYMKCERCKRQFKSFKAYHSHKKKNPASCAASSYIRIEGEGRNRMFHCTDCEYKSIRVKDLMSHYLVHSGIRPHTCTICSKTFTQLGSLWAHQENVHHIYKVEGTCHICGKHFKGRNKFYKHIKEHDEVSQECQICKKVVKSKKILKEHMKRHSDYKSMSCEMCGSRFYTISDLCNHRRNTHFRQKQTFTCDLCDYVAHRNETIKKHRAKHTATNIPCKFCGTFLETEQAFLLHQKRHIDRKFACPECDKQFYKKRYLNHHMRKNHGCDKSDPKVPVNKVRVKEEMPVIVHYDDIVTISPIVVG